MHLKFVHEPVFAIGTHDRDGLILAFIEVENVEALYANYLTIPRIVLPPTASDSWWRRALRNPPR